MKQSLTMAQLDALSLQIAKELQEQGAWNSEQARLLKDSSIECSRSIAKFHQRVAMRNYKEAREIMGVIES